ncbi:hypothetical protein FE257_004055 [Aspergillus nanangensis]|uniref:Uncharacterized protein n=1 Tax=Aspergillus nanangensis TaxID=2582783 RepID=A0AAD4GN84_ASPNN|nr:hypothetical protein FE257_004055 [Aspergillus nanangensis]
MDFNPSKPTTPLSPLTPKRRSIDHGHGMTPTTPSYRSQSFRNQPDINGRTRRASSHSFDGATNAINNDTTSRHTQREDNYRHSPYSPSSAFLGLISGDEGRDFEGLGGWRCGPSKSQGGYKNISPSSSSASISTDKNEVNEDADDRAWLSINHRLELPSQPLSQRNSHPDIAEQSLPWRHRLISPNGPRSPGSLYHHRSATTSMLPSLNRPGQLNSFAALSVSTTPDQSRMSPRSRAISPHSHPHGPPSETMHSIGDRLSQSVDESDGYFDIPTGGSCLKSPPTTPSDGRRTPRSLGMAMAHYPAGVRYRRKSLPASSAGPQLGFLGTNQPTAL